jgi:hemerythrin superfamily protein
MAQQRQARPTFPAAIRMIRMDHARVLACYQRVKPGMSPAALAAICSKIYRMLEIHNQLEEELFYPALRECGMSMPELEHSRRDHDGMHMLMEHVRSLAGQGQAQADALTALIAEVLKHAVEEEAHVLPAAQRLLGPERLNALGARMTRRRFELTSPVAASVATALRAAPLKTALLTAGTLRAGGAVVQRLWPGRFTRH